MIVKSEHILLYYFETKCVFEIKPSSKDAGTMVMQDDNNNIIIAIKYGPGTDLELAETIFDIRTQIADIYMRNMPEEEEISPSDIKLIASGRIVLDEDSVRLFFVHLKVTFFSSNLSLKEI